MTHIWWEELDEDYVERTPLLTWAETLPTGHRIRASHLSWRVAAFVGKQLVRDVRAGEPANIEQVR